MFLTESQAWARIARKKRFDPGFCGAITELLRKGKINRDTYLKMSGRVKVMLVLQGVYKMVKETETGIYLFPPGEVDRRQILALRLSRMLKIHPDA